MTEKYLKASEVADALQVSEQTLANWRAQGKGPTFIKLGSGRTSPVRYLPLQEVANIAEKKT